MATLRDFAPGLGDGTLPSAAPGLRPVSVADMPVNYAPDNSALERTMERDGMSQARLGYESMRLGDKANWLEVEAAAREAAGDLQGAQALRARNAGLRQESGFYAPKEQDITRIGLDEPGRILDYGLGAVGSVAASMQDGMASGAGAKLATNALGMIPHPFTQAIGRGANLLSAGAAFVPNLMSNSGEQLSSYRDDPTIMANTTAGERLARGLGTGAVMGALDTLPEVGMLSRLGGKGAAHGIMRGTALDTAKEMATETAQTGVQKLDLSNLNPGRDTTDDWRDYANSAAQAGMGGAPLHGAANVLGAMGSRVREPGDPGMNKGDEIDLKTGKKTDGTLASFDEQLKAAGSPGQFKSLKEAENRRDLLTGRGFGDVDTHGPEEAFASNRQAALLEELSKTNTPEAQAHAAKVAAVDISDPFSTFDHPDFEAASDYVTPRAGLDFDGLDRLAKGFKNKRVKKNERLFAPQDHIPLGGELSMRAKTVAGLIEQLRPDAEEGKREPADMRSFLRATARDIVSMVNMEGEPSEGELVRAKRLGSIVGSYLGDNTEAGLAQLGKAAGGKTNKLFEAFASHAALHSGKADAVTSKTIEDDGAELADRVVGMIPQERIDALQTKGINLYEPRVQSHLVRSLQAMFDGHGDGSITLERAEQMFGKEAVSEIEKLIGLNLGRGFGDETDQFERDAKEKSITTAGEKIGDGTAAFGRGMKKNGIALGDLFDAKKNGLLPSLWSPGEHGDSVRDAMERDVAGASEKDAHVRTLPVTRVLEAQGFRGGSLKHKRLELMERYLDAAAKKARDPKAVEKLTALKTALGELRQGERFDKQLTDIFQGRDSLGPDGGRMTVNQRASLKKLAYGGGMVDEGGGAPRMEYSPIAKFLGEDHPLSADLRRFGAAGKSAKEILDTPELHTIMHKAVREAVAKHLATIGKLAPGLLRNDANGEPANASTDLAERYFEDKHLTLATPTGTTATPDHLKLTKIAFRQMTKRGGEVAGLIRGGKVRDAADEGLLFFYGSKADADADKKDGVYNRPTESKRMAAVKGDDIVAWVRAGEYSHTKTVGGGKERKATGNRAYFDLLSQGIGALVDGHAHTMPVDIKGGSDYRLETSSVGAIAKARDKAATARAAEAAEFMGPPDSRGVGATEEQRDAELAKDYAHEEVAELHADGFYEDGTTSEADPDQEADEFEHVRLKNTVYAAARMPEEISVRSGSLERDARRHGEALWGDYLKDREAGLARIIGVAKEMAQNPLLAAVLAFVATPEHLRAMAPRLVVNNENIGGQATDTVKDYALLRGLRVDVAKTILGGTGYGKNLVRPKDIDALQEALGGKLEDIIKSAKAKGWSPMSYAPAVPRIEITQEERKATPGKAMEGALRSSIEERKVQRLEKELSEIDGKLAELRKTVAPITKLKAEIAARKDTASYVATERKTGDVPRSAAVEGHTAPATASRRERYRKGFRLAHEAGPDGAAKAKPLTPAEIKAGRNAAKVNLAAELKAMRTELRSMIQATGFADLRTMRAEMAALSARKTDITKVLADADRRTTPSTTEMRTGENWAPIAGGKVVETPVAKKVKAKVEPASTGLAALPQHKPGQKTMRYAGIGSRRTPPEMAARMTKVAQWLAKQGYTLFSGGADGADKAFEAGAGTTKEIFRASDATDAMIAVAREVHPRPEALGEYPLKLMARNTAQVFGRDLSEPVDFVLAWTPDGAEATAERTISTGGTGQAIDLASRKGVPVINLAREGWEARLKAAVAGETKPAADKTIVGDLWAQPGVKIVGVKLSQRDFSADTVADRLGTSRDIMRSMGFKSAPQQFADVAAKLLTNPDQDAGTFIKQAAEALSHVLAAGENFNAIRDALQGDKWFAERAKITARLTQKGMMRGDAMVEAYRVLTERALAGELNARGIANRTLVAKVVAAVKRFIAQFRAATESDAFTTLVRGMLNEAVEKANSPLKLKEGYRKVSFQDAVDADPTSAAVLAHMSKNPNVTLTGSIVLANAGTIYRDAANMLHDLDLIVSGTKEDAEAYLRSKFPDAVQVYDFQTSNGKVDTFVVPPAGAQVSGLTREFGDKGKITGFVITKDGKQIGRTWTDASGEHKEGTAGTIVDFFTNAGSRAVGTAAFTVDGKNHSVKVAGAGAGSIFDAKLAIRRQKDIDDYTRFVPTSGKKLNQRDFPAGTAKTAQRATNTATQPTPSDADIEAIRGQIDRLLGPKIKAAFEEAFGANGSWDNVTKIVTIALAPLAQMKSVAYHEGMHAFFSERLAAMPEVKAMLYRAMEEPRVKERLQFLLRNSPAALKAMERDPEEAVAYAFEFWTEGLLSLGKSPTTFFERVQRFFRGVFGMISDGERSLEIFQALYDGKMVEPSAAEKAIQEAMSRGEGMRAAALKVDKQGRWLKTRIMAANRVLAETGPVGKALADQWYVNPGSTKQGTDAGVMNRRQSEMRKRTNRLYSEVIHGLNQQEVEALNDLAESKTDVEQVEDPRLKKALGNLYRLSADMYRYIKDAGVETGVRDDGRYTPMVWSQQYMIEHKDKFVAMLLEHYPDMLKAAKATAGQVAGKNLTPEDVAAHMWQSIIDRTGVDAKMEAQRDDGVLSPFFASENGRSFDWIAPEHRKEFLSHDIVHNMTSYIHQAVRSAEYVRTFGSRGHLLAATLQRVGDYIGTNKDGTPKYADEDGPLIEEIRAKAVADKVPTDKLEAYVLRRHDAARESVGAMEGVLGKDISDIARKANSYLMTYQHLRLLPLSLFAAMLDPVGIMVSGGTLDDAIGAYVRGMRGVVKTWKSLATGIPLTLDGDQDEMDAMMVGTLDSDMLLEGVGNAHTGEYMDKGVRRINHKFFELNGLTAWDRSMRVVATRTGIKFIMSHDKNSNPAHSKRWMEALGLEQGKLIYGADGKLVLDARVLAKIRAEGKAGSGEKFAALSDDQRQTLIDTETRAAEEYMNKLHFGIQRFVQRGVLSPNAAVRPAWASDPHYAAVFHLKQYTYGFHEIIMRHIREEAEAGNYAPGMMALVGVPVMIAADITKGLLTGGGSLPGYMANWGLADWLMHGWARAGLNGIGQIGIDTIHNPASIFGPTADQIADFALSPLDKLEHADMVPGVRIIMR